MDENNVHKIDKEHVVRVDMVDVNRLQYRMLYNESVLSTEI